MVEVDDGGEDEGKGAVWRWVEFWLGMFRQGAECVPKSLLARVRPWEMSHFPDSEFNFYPRKKPAQHRLTWRLFY